MIREFVAHFKWIGIRYKRLKKTVCNCGRTIFVCVVELLNCWVVVVFVSFCVATQSIYVHVKQTQIICSPADTVPFDVCSVHIVQCSIVCTRFKHYFTVSDTSLFFCLIFWHHRFNIVDPWRNFILPVVLWAHIPRISHFTQT